MIIKPLFPVTWIIASAILVLGVLAWLEVKRSQRFLAARVLALVLIVFSVCCLIINPSLRTKKSSDIIVLTPGYNPEILDSLLNKNPKSQVYKLPGAESNHGIEIKNYRNVSDLKGSLFLLGEGLPQYMLEYVDISSLQYFPSPNPNGIIAIDLNKIYTVNQRGELNGMLNLKSNGTVKLTGPGGLEDSVRISAEHSQSFSLTFTPKVSGLYLYTLAASDSSGGILFSEEVPIQVKEQKSLSVLFLSGHPSAEVRFLKNFLEKRNHKLTLHYKISKDKYRTEFVNTPKKSIGRLNEDLLQTFDLVLTDAAFLNSLSVSEIQAVKKAMQGGLGILTLINTPSLSKQGSNILDLTFNKIKSDSAQLFVSGKKFKIPASPLIPSSNKKLFRIRSEPSGRMVSGYYHSGMGKSGFQLLTNTFNLALAGEEEVYAELWSPLIKAVARTKRAPYDLSFTTPFPYYRDEPIEFKIITAAEKPTLRIDSTEIPIVEDPLTKDVWFGKVWAGQPGWNSLNIDQDSSQHNFFVSQKGNWNSLRAVNQQKSLRKLSSPKEHVVEQIQFQPIPRIIFFLVFLLSAGFLWLAPKL